MWKYHYIKHVKCLTPNLLPTLFSSIKNHYRFNQNLHMDEMYNVNEVACSENCDLLLPTQTYISTLCFMAVPVQKEGLAELIISGTV